MNKSKNKDRKNRIIQRQVDEIECLKQRISQLEIDCKDKDELINSIDSFRTELTEIVDNLKKKGEEYDSLIAELMQMRKVMNEGVFNKKWRLIKWLVK